MKHGILLVNLGTPKAPTVKAVRKYLQEFLSDERVIDLPKVPRAILLNGVILPFRPFKTTKAYQEVWDKEKGSPLLYLSDSLTKHLQTQMGDQYIVKLAMRYGQPSMQAVLDEMLPQVKKLTVVPMYPQYASSTTGSVVEALFKIVAKQWNMPKFEILNQFYDKIWYQEALAHVTKPFLDSFKPDHILMSFHGLPVRQIEKSEAKACEQTQVCPNISDDNYYCYRAQCYQTAKDLARALSIENTYSVGFQSRLGRIPWIQPYLDEVLPKLISRGVKRLSVVCPSFTTDCLETLEEIGIRLRETWLTLGGEAFQLVPALNDDAFWVKKLAQGLKQDQTETAKMALNKKNSTKLTN